MHSTNFYRDDDDMGPGDMPFRGFEPALERHARLAGLAPLAAVRAWLTGNFGPGDEDALCASIRRDPAVDLTDDEIISVFYEVLGEDDFRADTSEAVLTLLREAAQFRETEPTKRRR